MRIITWNCNLNLVKKFQLIEKNSPDLVIIQECEKLSEKYFPKCKYFWIGKNDTKGLGVLVFNQSAKIDKCFNEKFIYFLPIQTDEINILGLWAYNHRASLKFGSQYEGSTSDAIRYYQPWLVSKNKAISSGDFNNSIIWDVENKENNFKNINSTLENLGFKSSYHQLTKEEFGKESKGTLFHTKNREKSYHIDYIYLKGLIPNSLQLGEYNDWIKFSDHMPVIVDIKL